MRRLAAAYPDTVDAVFRKILRRRDFTWAEDGEALMRRRKAWYYRHEPRPGVTVIGEFNGWNRISHPMQHRDGGVWELFIPALGCSLWVAEW